MVQQFSLKYIENATCSYKTLIGEGGFGAVFRGTLPHGQEVAVKVRSATSTQGTREFDNEVKRIIDHLYFSYMSCWVLGGLGGGGRGGTFLHSLTPES